MKPSVKRKLHCNIATGNRFLYSRDSAESESLRDLPVKVLRLDTMKLLSILLVALMLIGSKADDEVGQVEDRDLNIANRVQIFSGLFNMNVCERRLRRCQRNLGSNRDAWKRVAASSGNARIMQLPDRVTDYSALVASFATLSTAQRSNNAPRILSLFNALESTQTESSETEDPGSIPFQVLSIARAVTSLVGQITGLNVSLVLFILGIAIDFLDVIATRKPAIIINFIAQSVVDYFATFSKNVRMLNNFAQADSGCMMALMECEEQIFLNQVTPSLVELSKMT